MTIGAKIKELRQREKLSQNELAQKLAVSNRSIWAWEADEKTPKNDVFKKLSILFNVPICYFFDFECSNMQRPQSNIEENYSQLDKHGKDVVDAVIKMELKRMNSQPLHSDEAVHHITYFSLPACAGMGNFWGDTLPEIALIKGNIPSGTDFIIPISGDSMEPMFYDGDKIFIHKTNSLEPDDIGVFSVDGQVYIKKYTSSGLEPLNTKYDIMTPDDFFIIGKVLGRCDACF